jgi:V/A-type H+-transporting ATPase subunit D
MAAVKLTKNELKKQKDALKRFRRYLPTLQLKKQQLQMVLRQIELQKKEMEAKKLEIRKDIERWVAVFGNDPGIANWLKVRSISTGKGNIAGIDIPIFKGVEFDIEPYSLYETDVWVDAGLVALKTELAVDAELKVLQVQYTRIEQELRITSQRVNLFEKVKIPETRENIRTIQIYLGDQQTAAVVRGKIAKSNLVRGGLAS